MLSFVILGGQNAILYQDGGIPQLRYKTGWDMIFAAGFMGTTIFYPVEIFR